MKNLFIKNPFECLQKGAVVILCIVLAGTFSSCSSSENDIDMSDIDFSNIENLYEQPLPVIQKCVQGKWKWYAQYGGDAGVSYSVKTFVDIKNDHIIVDYDDESQLTFYYTWKKRFVYGNKYETYVMWSTERDAVIWHFESIKNDTLCVGTAVEQIVSVFVRINEK